MKKWLDQIDAAPPRVVIARFNADRNPQKPLPQNPAVHFQVTVKAENKSPSGEFMRFGAPGDEILGWMRCDQIWIEEVLGVSEDGKEVKPQEQLREAA